MENEKQLKALISNYKKQIEEQSISKNQQYNEMFNSLRAVHGEVKHKKSDNLNESQIEDYNQELKTLKKELEEKNEDIEDLKYEIKK